MISGSMHVDVITGQRSDYNYYKDVINGRGGGSEGDMYCITINLKGTFISCSCTCVSSDDSHCFIANRNQGNTPGKFSLTSIRSATVCALLIDIICPSNTE